MTTYKVNNTEVVAERSTYTYGNKLAVILTTVNGEPYATITVNLPDSYRLEDKNCAFVDTNNCPWAERFICENDLGEFTGWYGFSGFCSYPMYRFNTDKIQMIQRGE